jgi:RNA polymerase sigma-70 factor, ECF subfamily
MRQLLGIRGEGRALGQGDHDNRSAARLRSAHDERLAALFREHADFVWRVVKRLGVPEADAEDAVQEVFLVVARRLADYEERGALRPWLVAIARQVAQHTERARFRRERKVRELSADPRSLDPHRVLEQNQAIAFVNEFIAGLDPDHALVFSLAELEGMTAPEIAASLQLKLNTVYSRLRRVRQSFEARVQRNMQVQRRLAGCT